ncbi:BlaI/MecI/CopY family transcriptional regulator [Candidatus Poribacteria bacterium]|nr:BlaI/MecI/CopY family transcriptional regulator [Candidatus Poribacteria bacterium]
MPRKKSPTLTEAELRLMKILWEKGEGTVNDVVNALPSNQPLAYKTVLTILRILEQKGYLEHNKQSRAFVYYPIVEREEARRHAVKDMVSRFFDDSPELLVLRILEDEDIELSVLSQLKETIQKRQSEVSQ